MARMTTKQETEILMLANGWLTRIQLDGLVDVLFSRRFLSEIDAEQANQVIRLLRDRTGPGVQAKALRAVGQR